MPLQTTQLPPTTQSYVTSTSLPTSVSHSKLTSQSFTFATSSQLNSTLTKTVSTTVLPKTTIRLQHLTLQSSTHMANLSQSPTPFALLQTTVTQTNSSPLLIAIPTNNLSPNASITATHIQRKTTHTSKTMTSRAHITSKHTLKTTATTSTPKTTAQSYIKTSHIQMTPHRHTTVTHTPETTRHRHSHTTHTHTHTTTRHTQKTSTTASPTTVNNRTPGHPGSPFPRKLF